LTTEPGSKSASSLSTNSATSRWFGSEGFALRTSALLLRSFSPVWSSNLRRVARGRVTVSKKKKKKRADDADRRTRDATRAHVDRRVFHDLLPEVVPHVFHVVHRVHGLHLDGEDGDGGEDGDATEERGAESEAEERRDQARAGPGARDRGGARPHAEGSGMEVGAAGARRAGRARRLGCAAAAAATTTRRRAPLSEGAKGGASSGPRRLCESPFV